MKNRKFTKRMFAVIGMMGLLYISSSVSMAYQVEVSGDSTRVRQTASTDSDTISAVNKGDKLEVLSEVTASDGKVWYQVSINNIIGYIRSDTVKKVEASSAQAEQPVAQPVVAETAVTAMDSQSATIKADSVNVRSQASTSANAVATVKKGTAITLTGTATGTDGKKWYQVSYINNGSDVKGFIREDLVTIGEAVPASEEGGEAEAPEGEAAEGGEEGAPEDAELAAMYGDMPEEEGAGGTAPPNQDYELKYDNEWYVYDYTVNKRYKLAELLNAAEMYNSYKESTDKDSNQQKIVIIVLAVLLALAVIAAAFLGFKYYSSLEDEDDDEEEEEPRRSGFRRRSRRDEDDDEEEDEDEDDFEEARPVRRPVRKEEPRQRTREENRRSEGAARRPAGTGQRRPRPEGGSGAAARPAGRGAAPQGQRRPRPETPEARPARRPAPAGQPRRPAPETVRTDSARPTAQPGKVPRSGAAKSDVTWKSKNFLTEDEDGLDFSFIDMNEDT